MKKYLALLAACVLLLAGCQAKDKQPKEQPTTAVEVTQAPTQEVAVTEPPTPKTVITETPAPKATLTDVPVTDLPQQEATDAPLAETTDVEEKEPQQTFKDKVLATVDGTPIMQSETDILIPTFVNYNYVAGEDDYQTAVKYLVQQMILQKKIVDMGFDQFTEEEMTAINNDAQAEWEAALDAYVQYFLAEDTEEARKQARTDAELYYLNRGITLDFVVKQAQKRESVNRMTQYLLGGYEPSEEEINQLFATIGAQYEAQYKDNVAEYELSQYYGAQSWYTPEGYRGILHILIKPDQEVLDSYLAMVAAYEEQSQPENDSEETTQKEEPGVVIEPVTIEQVEAAKKLVLDSQKDLLAEIQAKISANISFVELIKEYGEDPGMEDEQNLAEGYSVHSQSIMFDPAFTQGAFAPEMQRVGDVSEPVVGQFGIHILYYLRDVPSGLILTDEIYQEIYDYLLNDKEQEVYEEAFVNWEKNMEVIYNQDMIDLATQEARERIAQEESETLEALTEEGSEQVTEEPKE